MGDPPPPPGNQPRGEEDRLLDEGRGKRKKKSALKVKMDEQQVNPKRKIK